MRGKLSDQDLTDYALNELDPNERLYVESMLAVSEECRNDIYEMIDMAMQIEEGFEREDNGDVVLLTPEQRMALLDVKMPNHFVRRTAGVLAAAAAIALALFTRDEWLPKNSMSRVAKVSSGFTEYVQQAVTAAEGEDFVNSLASFRQLTEGAGKLLPSQPVGGAAVFGPPSSLNMEIAPHPALELTP